MKAELMFGKLGIRSLAPEILWVAYNTNNEYHKVGIYDFATGEAKVGYHYYTYGTGHDMSGNNIEYHSKETGKYTVVAKNDYYLYKFSDGVYNDQVGLVLVGKNASEDVALLYAKALYFVTKEPITFDETFLGAL